LILFGLLLTTNLCAQEKSKNIYLDEDTLYHPLNKSKLIDPVSGEQYFIDSTHKYVSAFDKSGRQLWRTDPRIDNPDQLDTYKIKRPVIVYFSFDSTKSSENKNTIWIMYNNTQMGVLDRKSGKFRFRGQY